MKKVSEIMKELGFRPEGSDEVKKAFIKNLIKQSNHQEAQRRFYKDSSSEAMQKEKTEESEESYEQLSLFTKKRSS